MVGSGLPVDRSVGRSIDRSVGWSVGRSVATFSHLETVPSFCRRLKENLAFARKKGRSNAQRVPCMHVYCFKCTTNALHAPTLPPPSRALKNIECQTQPQDTALETVIVLSFTYHIYVFLPSCFCLFFQVLARVRVGHSFIERRRDRAVAAFLAYLRRGRRGGGERSGGN